MLQTHFHVFILLASLGSFASMWSEPANLASINSSAHDFGPSISSDGLELYFTSNREGSVAKSNGTLSTDIWVATRASLDEPFANPQALGPNINTSTDEFVSNLSQDGQTLYFSRGGIPGPTLFSPQIHVARRQNNSTQDWSKAQTIGIVNYIDGAAASVAPHLLSRRYGQSPILYFAAVFINPPSRGRQIRIYEAFEALKGEFLYAFPIYELNEGDHAVRPNLSPDGLQIFFYSSRKGSLGKEDIWTSKRNRIEQKWTQPVNLGSPINGNARDLHPSWSNAQKTLYFASDRKGGLGLFDIWMAKQNEQTRK